MDCKMKFFRVIKKGKEFWKLFRQMTIVNEEQCNEDDLKFWPAASQREDVEVLRKVVLVFA